MVSPSIDSELRKLTDVWRVGEASSWTESSDLNCGVRNSIECFIVAFKKSSNVNIQ